MQKIIQIISVRSLWSYGSFMTYFLFTFALSESWNDLVWYCNGTAVVKFSHRIWESCRGPDAANIPSTLKLRQWLRHCTRSFFTEVSVQCVRSFAVSNAMDRKLSYSFSLLPLRPYHHFRLVFSLTPLSSWRLSDVFISVTLILIWYYARSTRSLGRAGSGRTCRHTPSAPNTTPIA